MKNALFFLSSFFFLSLVGRGVLEFNDLPHPQSAIAWKDPEVLERVPFQDKVLVVFSAGWCPSCRKMELTVFRSKQFAKFLERNGYCAVKVTPERNPKLFEKLGSKYRIGVVPALVVLRRDGRVARIWKGEMDQATLEWRLDPSLENLNPDLSWFYEEPVFDKRDNKVVCRFFQRRMFLQRENYGWQFSPSPEFVEWAEQHLNLFSEDWGKKSLTFQKESYKGFGIRTVPTMIAFSSDGKEIMRFEGQLAIQEAPKRIAEYMKAKGIPFPSPPP